MTTMEEAPPTALVAEVTFWEKVVEYDTEPIRRGQLVVDGIVYDFTATPADVQPVPHNAQMYDADQNPFRLHAIEERHWPVKSKEDRITRLIIDFFIKGRRVRAGIMWDLLYSLEHLSDRIDDRETYEWRVAFDTTWRKLNAELQQSRWR